MHLFKNLLFIAFLALSSVTAIAKDDNKNVTQPVPAIYDQAIATAEKQNAIVDTIDVMSNKM